MIDRLNFPITRFAIKFKANNTLRFYEYAGSTLRGVFGTALKNMACVNQDTKGQCQCLADNPCLYRTLFEPCQKPAEQMPSPPFIIEAHGLPTVIYKGQTAVFYMVLIGKIAHDELTFIKLVWQQALQLGIRYGNQKATATVLEITPYNTPIKQLAKSTAMIDLVTHTQLKHQNQVVDAKQFDAKIFCTSLVRRFKTLMTLYGTCLDEQDFDNLYQDAQKVTAKSMIQDSQWARYSNRQKQKMNLKGITGSVELCYISEELYHLLHLGQWLHVGKGCVFGLGQYQIR